MERVRNKPHVPGNWATLIYIPVKTHCCTLPEQFNMVESVHLSLSRTLYVKDMHKELLLQRLEKALKPLELPKEPLLFTKPAKYTNDEGTCHFLALDLEGENAYLIQIVKAIDAVLKSFGLPQYYNPPRFHVSLAWRLDEWGLEDVPPLEAITVTADEILMKCGNKVHKLR